MTTVPVVAPETDTLTLARCFTLIFFFARLNDVRVAFGASADGVAEGDTDGEADGATDGDAVTAAASTVNGTVEEADVIHLVPGSGAKTAVSWCSPAARLAGIGTTAVPSVPTCTPVATRSRPSVNETVPTGIVPLPDSCSTVTVAVAGVPVPATWLGAESTTSDAVAQPQAVVESTWPPGLPLTHSRAVGVSGFIDQKSRGTSSKPCQWIGIGLWSSSRTRWWKPTFTNATGLEMLEVVLLAT